MPDMLDQGTPGEPRNAYLDILNRETPVDDFTLGDGHVVVVHLLVVHLPVDVERVGGLSQHQLHFGQGTPPDTRIPGLQFGDALVEEVDKVGVDGLEDGDGRDGVEVGPVPLVQQGDIVTHCHCRVDSKKLFFY